MDGRHPGTGFAEFGASTCSNPYKLPTGVSVRCGSRSRSKCESCAELYRGDWAAIARSGVFDGPVERYRFYLLTLTAPSFGRVHRVPRKMTEAARACGCGAAHTANEGDLRGVPLDPASYDYAGQVAWNRDSGILWDRTRKRLRDRWPSVEYFIVREWQDRGVLHVHAILRIARAEAPDSEALRDAARTAVGISKVDGSTVAWGNQARCDPFRADGDGARTIWYLSKALNYVMKDTVREAPDRRGRAWEHTVRLEQAAWKMRCSWDCEPRSCGKRVHRQFGSRSHVVSASRRTSRRTGWSFTGLTRKLQRALRKRWFDEHEAADERPPSPTARHVDRLAELIRTRASVRVGTIP